MADKTTKSSDITPSTKEASPARGTDPAGNTAGNTGLTEDVFAESRAKEEAAAEARQAEADKYKVPTEALTPEAQAYTEAGEKAEEEAEKEWATKVETTETGVAPDQTTSAEG